MCKRILTHQMHHDVRIPIITDLHSDNPRIYADSRHTRCHQCELTRPLPNTWMLNSPYPPCPFHSCCILNTDFDFCPDFYAKLACSGIDDPYAENCIPEGCKYFICEHRHVRLEYFGRPEAYSVNIPATWREDIQEHPYYWSYLFNREKTGFSGWEQWVSYECGIVYILEQDAKTLLAVYYDLINFWPPGDPNILIAEQIMWETQRKLIQWRESISSRMNWAQGWRFAPPEEFKPVWWIRMHELKDEVYKSRYRRLF
ncbi:hypothetical protein K449DRAFT_395102 [Hypoxylon sp. EC38]|nr:hypothetical protein K449DRAFT_395102 [Hypoxylon sp. EC38]